MTDDLAGLRCANGDVAHAPGEKPDDDWRVQTAWLRVAAVVVTTP